MDVPTLIPIVTYTISTLTLNLLPHTHFRALTHGPSEHVGMWYSSLLLFYLLFSVIGSYTIAATLDCI